jgi:hypothetical protein
VRVGTRGGDGGARQFVRAAGVRPGRRVARGRSWGAEIFASLRGDKVGELRKKIHGQAGGKKATFCAHVLS